MDTYDDEDVGTLVGLLLADRFQLERLLGVGGVGEVYYAQHNVLGVPYAVKVLREALADDEVIVERFRREAYAASRLHHPNIVQTHDFGRTEDEELYIVMEYVDGPSLRTLIAECAPGPPPLNRGLRILAQLASALEHAHAANIVHRDLKPDNILLTVDRDGGDVVKVLDFGLAKVLGDEGTAITQLGQVFGSPQYMSPEQARGEPVDTRSDIYSFGVLAYEVACGRPPFVYGSMPRLLVAHMEEKPPLPSAHLPVEAPPLPDPLESILLACLEKDPADRPATVGEVRKVLEGLLESLPAAPRRAIPEDVEKVIRDTGFDTVSPSGFYPATSTSYNPANQAATVPQMGQPADLPAARPGDPAYREWFWGQAVKLAVDLAEGLLQGEAPPAELKEARARATAAEDASIQADADVALVVSDLAEHDAAYAQIERDLRYAIVDLSMTCGRLMDADQPDEPRIGDLKQQIIVLEQTLRDRLREKIEQQAVLEERMAEKRAVLEERHQAQVAQETELIAALQANKPSPMPQAFALGYKNLRHLLKGLRQS